MFSNYVAMTLIAFLFSFQNIQLHATEAIIKAQAILPKIPLIITDQNNRAHKFSVELAKTPEQQEIGEMFRKHIPNDGGMLFLWDKPRRSVMWMKNTLVPLDMVFIDKNKKIHKIIENTIPQSEAILDGHSLSMSVLELPAGTTEKMNICVGDTVSSPVFR